MGKIINTDDLKRYLMDKGFYPALVAAAIENVPEGVVRCKDCKFWKPNDRRVLGYCKHGTFSIDDDVVDPITKPNDFCSYGERREDNG